jgi:hypothetical protein
VPKNRDVVILRNLHELDWNAVGEQRVGGLLNGRVS